jgi:hypothetical protein
MRGHSFTAPHVSQPAILSCRHHSEVLRKVSLGVRSRYIYYNGLPPIVRGCAGIRMTEILAARNDPLRGALRPRILRAGKSATFVTADGTTETNTALQVTLVFCRPLLVTSLATVRELLWRLRSDPALRLARSHPQPAIGNSFALTSIFSVERRAGTVLLKKYAGSVITTQRSFGSMNISIMTDIM